MEKLRNIIVLEGTMKLLTGLHIGAGNDEIKIGGIDSPVVRNPVTNEPYIPGSSIKGKMRFLLEWYLGRVDFEKGQPFSRTDDEKGRAICKIFGVSGSEDNRVGPARASFYDLFLTEDSKKLLESRVGALMTEDKVEVMVNRISGTGTNPRHTERVPAGAEFNFKLVYKVFDEEDEKFFDYLLKGLKLLEIDGIGGSVSRGYGKIKFSGLTKKSLMNNRKEEKIEDLDKIVEL